jgi:hypothetical protein
MHSQSFFVDSPGQNLDGLRTGRMSGIIALKFSGKSRYFMNLCASQALASVRRELQGIYDSEAAMKVHIYHHYRSQLSRMMRSSHRHFVSDITDFRQFHLIPFTADFN